MLKLGEDNLLKALRFTTVGVFLGNDEGDEVLLPNKYVPEKLQIDEYYNVFVYLDSGGREIATTLKPKIYVNEFALLKVKQVRELHETLEVDDWEIVYMYLDKNSKRLIGSTNINKFLPDKTPILAENEEVDILIFEFTDLGMNVIINNEYRGLVYHNEIFQKCCIGDKLKGFVKKLRTDNKIDVSLQKLGYQNVEPNAQKILNLLQKSDGFLPITDSSSPDLIYDELEMSKKTFKKSIGALYKAKQIRIEIDGIYLIY